MIEPTKLKYLDDSSLLTDTATIQEIKTNEVGKTVLVLDQTIFYPQGGGQPYDKGIIKNETGNFIVEEVRFADGFVNHIGAYKNGEFKVGDGVNLEVDGNIRLFNSRNHSAGHLIDVTMKNLGENLTPGKGFHFPQGSYVEYIGEIEEGRREEIKNRLQSEVNNLIQQNLPLRWEFMDLEKLRAVCDFVPDLLPEGKPIRAVFIGNYPGCPCGGTHVKATGELGNIVIEKIKVKSGNTRIIYKIS